MIPCCVPAISIHGSCSDVSHRHSIHESCAHSHFDCCYMLAGSSRKREKEPMLPEMQTAIDGYFVQTSLAIANFQDVKPSMLITIGHCLSRFFPDLFWRDVKHTMAYEYFAKKMMYIYRITAPSRKVLDGMVKNKIKNGKKKTTDTDKKRKLAGALNEKRPAGTPPLGPNPCNAVVLPAPAVVPLLLPFSCSGVPGYLRAQAISKAIAFLTSFTASLRAHLLVSSTDWDFDREEQVDVLFYELANVRKSVSPLLGTGMYVVLCKHVC